MARAASPTGNSLEASATAQLSTPAPPVHTGTSYTLALADNHRLVEMRQRRRDHRDRADRRCGHLPARRPHRDQTGVGQIISGSGVTLRLPSGKAAKTRLQYSIIALTKRNTNEWILSGDLA